MIEIGQSNENEMILAFLRAEVDSPRFGQNLVEPLTRAGYTRQEIIDNPDLLNNNHNFFRASLLDFRGYNIRDFLFKGFPRDVAWRRVELEPDEIKLLKYANYPTWIDLSGRTRLVIDGARNIDTIQVAEDANIHVKAVLAEIQNGRTYPELIAVERGSNLILVEGHVRATAYALAGPQSNIGVIIGSSSTMNRWIWY